MELSDLCWRQLLPRFDYYMTNSWKDGVKAGEGFNDALVNVAVETSNAVDNFFEHTDIVNYCLDSDDELLTNLLSFYLRKISQLDNLKIYIKNVTDLDAFRTLIEEDII